MIYTSFIHNRKELTMNSNSRTPIYRFKIIQNELEVEMNRFAILNQHNNHKELKEKYELWLNNSDILQLFQRETQLLREYNYDFKKHNLETKIFNSIKYYHIKKLNNPKVSQIKPRTKKKRIFLSSCIIQHCRHYLTQKNSIKSFEHQPNVLFESFKKSHEKQLNDDFHEMHSNHAEITIKDYDAKIKKMFKNQYYNLFQASII